MLLLERVGDAEADPLVPEPLAGEDLDRVLGDQLTLVCGDFEHLKVAFGADLAWQT
jgi:hypothetical protein